MVLVVIISSCGSKSDEVTEFTIRNDRIGMEISFNLPGDEMDWEMSDFDGGGTTKSHTIYPLGECIDATNSWTVNGAVTVGSSIYKDVLIDGEEPTDENETVVEAKNGIKWARYQHDDNYITYGTCLGDYLDGYYVAEIYISPNGVLEDGQKGDTELLKKIENTVINSFKYNKDYEGRPDHSDAAYTGSLIVKWPFEIPYENGIIKAESYVDNKRVSVKFEYQDPENQNIMYRAELFNDFIYDPEDNHGVDYMDEAYFGPDPTVNEGDFEEIEIAGYRAAMRFNFENIKDQISVECGSGETDERAVFDMFTFIESDNEADKADEKNKQKIIDMVSIIIENAEFL